MDPATLRALADELVAEAVRAEQAADALKGGPASIAGLVVAEQYEAVAAAKRQTAAEYWSRAEQARTAKARTNG